MTILDDIPSEQNAVVLFSGGLDSTVLLYWFAKKKKRLTALHYQYAQSNEVKEYQAFEAIQRTLPTVSFECIRLAPELMQSPIQHVQQFPAFRNGLFIAAAVPFAHARYGHAVVSIGVQGYYSPRAPGLHPQHPDTAEETLAPLRQSIRRATSDMVVLSYPFMRMSRGEVIQLGIELEVPMESTWTCFSNAATPCHRCSACTTRLHGFTEAKRVDPIYEAMMSGSIDGHVY